MFIQIKNTIKFKPPLTIRQVLNNKRHDCKISHYINSDDNRLTYYTIRNCGDISTNRVIDWRRYKIYNNIKYNNYRLTFGYICNYLNNR